jgi:hypothetical protein
MIIVVCRLELTLKISSNFLCLFTAFWLHVRIRQVKLNVGPTGPSRRFKIQKLGAYLLGALILIEPAVALLPLLHDLISAECPVAFLRRITVNISFGNIAK